LPRSDPLSLRGLRRPLRSEQYLTANELNGTDTLNPRVSPRSEIRRLARQLCYGEGMAWSLSDFEKGVFGVTIFTVVADEKKRREYLNRARLMLENDSK
jgi:hypothetical protein